MPYFSLSDLQDRLKKHPNCIYMKIIPYTNYTFSTCGCHEVRSIEYSKKSKFDLYFHVQNIKPYYKCRVWLTDQQYHHFFGILPKKEELKIDWRIISIILLLIIVFYLVYYLIY